QGDNKNYAAQYSKVKRTFHLSEPELEAVYAQPHARHFYSTEQIEQFMNRWRIPGGERSTHHSAHLSEPNPTLLQFDRHGASSILESPRTANRVLAKCRAALRRVFRGDRVA
ncbi:MAG TPA: hypothetical protein VG122_16785, partial [Gemmata sp.]|nr:hypothetical protein [Gemmata sp.]